MVSALPHRELSGSKQGVGAGEICPITGLAEGVWNGDLWSEKIVSQEGNRSG